MSNESEVTTPLKVFVETLFPFEQEDVAKKVAKKRGTTSEVIIAEWETSKFTSERYHHVVENILKALYKNEDLDTPQDDERFIHDQLIAFLTKECSGWTLHKTEWMVRGKGLTCSVDAIFKNDAGKYMICEWKFGSKLWFKSFDGDKGLGPLRDFDNCKYNKANLQIAFYKKICTKMEGLDVVRALIVHMNDTVSDTPTVLNPSNNMLGCVDQIWDEMSLASLYLTKITQNPPEAPSKDRKDLLSSPAKSKSACNDCGDVMIDFETLSTEPNAHILTIGAIKFKRDRRTEKLEEMDTFYRRISFSSNEDLEAHKSSDTILWWMRQSESARQEAFNDNERVDLKKALVDFSSWFKKGNKGRGAKHIWSHGSVFDVVILTEAMKKCQIEVPFKFWDVRDTRTAYELSSTSLWDFTDKGKLHHALYDCYHQIEALRMSFK